MDHADAPEPFATLPTFCREVLDLYATELSEVRFPDLDRDALEALASEVLSAEQEVARLEAELVSAQEQVSARLAVLGTRAERALAYARVYAEGQPELSARVQAIRSGAPSPELEEASAARKRGRPRKASVVSGATRQLDVLDIAAE